MPSRKGGKNPLREQASKAASISIDSNSSSSATPTPCQLPPPLPPHPYYSYRDPYHPPTYRHHRERSPPTPSLLEATLWFPLRLHLKSAIIDTNSLIISTGWREYIPPWRSSFRSV